MKRLVSFFGTSFLLLLFLALLAPAPSAPAATCTVTTNADSGSGSLREKIGDSSCTAIYFNSDYHITLSSPIQITRSMTIDGTGHTIAIDGNNATQVFQVTAGTFNLANLTVTNGHSTYASTSPSCPDYCGGGLYNTSTTIISGVTFVGNQAEFGGAIYSSGTFTMTNSTLSENVAYNSGYVPLSTSPYNSGGIFNSGTLYVVNSTFSDNGYALHDDGSGTSLFYNTILRDDCEASINGGNNYTDHHYCGTPQTILLAPLGNYGGPTQTYGLLPGSATIDGADDSKCPATDQRGVARPHGAVAIGAMTTLAQVAESPILRALANDVLAQAAHRSASSILRNQATVAGTLISEPNSVLAVALLALDARVTIVGKETRTIAFAEFSSGRASLQSALVTEIAVPMTNPRASLQVVARTPSDNPIVCVVASARIEGGKARDVRIALGGVSDLALRASAAEQALEGQTLNDAVIENVVGMFSRTPLQPNGDPSTALRTSFRGSAEYRKEMAVVLTRRAVKELASG